MPDPLHLPVDGGRRLIEIETRVSWAGDTPRLFLAAEGGVAYLRAMQADIEDQLTSDPAASRAAGLDAQLALVNDMLGGMLEAMAMVDLREDERGS